MRTYPRFTQETFPRTLVLANGAFPTAPAPLSLIDSWSQGKAGYTLTCCDGAVNKLRRYTEHLPDAVIGDLDSVSPALKDLLAGRIQHFPDQETNDLTKTPSPRRSRYSSSKKCQSSTSIRHRSASVAYVGHL